MGRGWRSWQEDGTDRTRLDAGWTRRRVLGMAVSTVAVTLVRGTPLAVASHVLRTPPQTRGPFYPLQLPLDKDNDLVTVAGRSGVARGQIAHVVGRVLDDHGRPLSTARVEIWQCDANGRYRHPGDQGGAALDPNFQGYGEFVTGADGAYRFRTIKPVPYTGRAPHIHFAIGAPGAAPLVTQLYIEGAPENARDFLLAGVAEPEARRRLIAPFERDPTLPTGELIARFDIVLAATAR